MGDHLLRVSDRRLIVKSEFPRNDCRQRTLRVLTIYYAGSGRVLPELPLLFPMVEGETHDSPVLTPDVVRTPKPINVENGAMKSGQTATSVTNSRRPTNFGIVPLPKRLVYDPERPAHFGLLLKVVFGLSSTFGKSLKAHIATAKALMISKYSCR